MLEQRVSSNESNVQTVMDYFKELREQRLSNTSMQVKNMNLGYTGAQGGVMNGYTAGSRVPPPSGTAMPAGLMSFNQEAVLRATVNHLQSNDGNSVNVQRLDGQSRGSSNYLQSNQGLARADLGMTETYNQRMADEPGVAQVDVQPELV